MDLSAILVPLVGAAIGYITNDIAIRMLFRPAEPKYIGKFHIPFTPGIIPKEKSRLAEAVGKAVSENLLAADVVSASLLSDRMLDKINTAIDGFIETARNNENTLESVLRGNTPEEQFALTVSNWKGKVTDLLAQKLVNADVGQYAAKGATDYAKKKSPSIFTNIVHGLMDEKLKHSIQEQIRDVVNDCIKDNAQSTIAGVIDNESDAILQMRICDLTKKYEDKLPAIRAKVIEIYKNAIINGTEKALKSIDLALIIREKIESIDNKDLEGMIRDVVNKELKAIVWLGALLGFLMGFINLLIL